MMRLLVGGDGHDPTVVSMPFLDPAEVKLSDLRVAFYTDCSPEIAQVIIAAAKQLATEAALVEEGRPACLEDAYDLEMQFIGPDGGDALKDYLHGIGSGRLHPLLSAWLAKLEPYRTDLAGFASYWSRLDRYRAEMLAFFRNYDVILCPAYTQASLPHGTSSEDANFRGFRHTMAYNMTGWPAAVVRCGTTAGGLPIAVQIVAHSFREDVALAVAARLEEAFGGWQAPSV